MSMHIICICISPIFAWKSVCTFFSGEEVGVVRVCVCVCARDLGCVVRLLICWVVGVQVHVCMYLCMYVPTYVLA